MGFLDEAVITVRSGGGGSGCVSFRRKKFIPRGGPDGGNGGDGGSIVVRATERLHSLVDYDSRKHFSARNGEAGRGSSQTGKNGADLILEVPLGTAVQVPDTGEILIELIHDNQEFVLVPGGRGGKGNQCFATSTNRAPGIARPGGPGQERRLCLSFKVLADIGLIGLPNTGKSTLLSSLSTARPKVAGYPFTTLTPNLGVMTFDDERSLIIADTPGLIEGSSQGRGLGHRFLKHVERTNLLLHLLDITYRPDNDILEDFHALRHELAAYSPGLAEKPQMALINKMDLHGPEHRDLGELREALYGVGVDSLPISALTGEGIGELKESILKKWVWDKMWTRFREKTY